MAKGNKLFGVSPPLFSSMYEELMTLGLGKLISICIGFVNSGYSGKIMRDCLITVLTKN
jgi:hypothetical protein